MFEVGEHIIHPGQGVCTVTGFKDGNPPMMILEAKKGHSHTRLLYPVSQSEKLHPAISSHDAEHVLSCYATLECDPFTERNSSLEETYFKQRLKLGAPETIRVAKTMRHRIHEAQLRDKKPSSYYQRILKEAHRRSVEEIAVALNISEEEAEQRITTVIDQSSSVN